MHKDLKFNLESIKEFQSDVPGIGNFPDRMLAQTYEEFVSVLYKDIDRIVITMEKNPELQQNDSEDRLTIEIRGILEHSGYDATHEEKIGGHADLVVKKNDWLWIGEAKIHYDYGHLFKGFQQLSTRYSTGGSYNSQGGMLIYIFGAKAKIVMDTWKTHLKEKMGEDNLEFFECQANLLYFYSEHSHQRTGLAFKVRHIPFCLHFDPKDKK